MVDIDLEHGRICARILDNLSTAALLFDVDKHLLYINQAGEMLFAASIRHLQGTAASNLLHCPRDSVNSVLDRALQTGQPFTEREVQLPCSNGRVEIVNCTVIPVESPDTRGEILVELQQVGHQLRISREEQVIAQYQVTRALVRGVAHEIKNPLGGVRGAAQLLERELPNQELQEYTRIIIEEADRLQNLVDRMLGPNQVAKKKLTNLHQLLERVYALVEVELDPAQSGIELVRDYDPSIPEFEADPDQLIQAFLNIVRNAIQALHNKGRVVLRTRIQRQFTIAMKRHRLAVRVEVIDNGPGISKEVQETLFFPMVTGRTEGTGLGLSIAQSLIGQHGGLIECTSRPGKTKFTVVLPLERGDDE